MTVHIGIVTHNSLSDLPECFEGIHAQTYAPLSVTVFDNGSIDASPIWITQYAPDVTLIQYGLNIGFGNAHNYIIQSLKFDENDYYLALNPDVRLQPTYIEAIIDAINGDDCIGWATGKLLFPPSESQSKPPIIYSVGHGLFPSGYAINIGHQMEDLGQFDESREIFGASGAAVIYKSALIRDLSVEDTFFDTDMFMYIEDVDVDWRARRRGWKCKYVAGAVAFHTGGSPSSELRDQAIVNRYLAVLKTAYLVDLVVFNMPSILLHFMFRICITPRRGSRMLMRFLRLAPRKVNQRQYPIMPYLQQRAWFKWSKQQPTNQPVSLIQRLRDFFKQKSQ